MFDRINPQHDFNYEIIISRKGDMITLRIPPLGLLVSGTDIALLYAEILANKQAYLDKAAAADLLETLPPASTASSMSAPTAQASVTGTTVIKGDLRNFILKMLIVVGLLLGSVAIVGISLKSSLNIPVGKKFWTKVSDGLHQAAQPGQGMSPEEQERIKADLRALVGKYKPFVDEVRPLLTDGSGAACR